MSPFQECIYNNKLKNQLEEVHQLAAAWLLVAHFVYLGRLYSAHILFHYTILCRQPQALPEMFYEWSHASV